MAISKQRKTELLDEYRDWLESSAGMILVDYRGSSVDAMSGLRRELRPLDGRLRVVKNTLFKLALEQVGKSLPDEWLTGPTAISFCSGEVPAVAKVLKGAEKDLGTLAIKGGLVGEAVSSADQVRAIAELPSRDVLLAQVLGTVNAPASQLVGVVASGIRQVLNVLQAYKDKLQEVGAAEEAGPQQAAQVA